MTKKNANVALLFVFLHTIVQVGLKINEFILLHVNYMCIMFTLGSSFFPLQFLQYSTKLEFPNSGNQFLFC